MPWRVQQHIRLIRNESSLKLYNLDKEAPEVSLEQKIMMLKIDESTKQKALSRNNEAKGRQNDSSYKALNWVNEFVKIPFEVYKEEECLFHRREMIESIQNTIRE